MQTLAVPLEHLTPMGPIALLLAVALAAAPAIQAAVPAGTRLVRSEYADLELHPVEEGAAGLLALTMTVRPEAGLHIYAALPAAPRQGPSQTGAPTSFLGPTLSFPPGSGVEVVSVDAPPPQVMGPATTSPGARVYQDAFTLRFSVRLRQGRTRVRRLTGTFRYQACTDLVCYKPTSVRLEWMRPGTGRTPVR